MLQVTFLNKILDYTGEVKSKSVRTTTPNNKYMAWIRFSEDGNISKTCKSFL